MAPDRRPAIGRRAFRRPAPPARRARTQCTGQRGFSLVELIVIMIVLSILAVVALPRFSGGGDFDALKFYDETLAAVRYAQKIAVAQNTQVFVVSTASSVSICFVAACGAPVTDPGRNAPLVVSAPAAGIGLAAPPATFSFDGLGRPSAGPVAFTFLGSPARSFTVEAETGHVHP